MTVSNQFKKVNLVKNGLVLIFKSDLQKQIAISELDKVYITVDKIAPIYTFCYILISIALMLFSIWFLRIDFILFLPLLLIVVAGVKIKNYKIYGLEICLKNGEYFKKPVAAEFKYDTIEIVNSIRKEIYTFKIAETNNISF